MTIWSILKPFTVVTFAATSLYANAASMDEIYADIQSCSPDLIAQQGNVAVAAGSLDMERAKRLPTFSLKANGTRYASADNTLNKKQNDTALTADGSYTLLSFGKQGANEALRESKLTAEQITLVSRSQSVLQDLLTKRADFDRLQNDIAVLKVIVDQQQLILDRVQRRAKVALSSEMDENAVFSKVWQNKNTIRENQLQSELLRSEMAVIACTERLSTITLDQLPVEESDTSILTAEFVTTEIAAIEARLESKRHEVAAADVALYPDLDLKASVPVSERAKTDSSLGLEFNVEYGNLGQAQAAQAAYLRKEVDAIERELSVAASRRVQELVRLEQQIATLRESVIPNQTVSIEAVREKVASKERLFKAGRVALFELLSSYDEVLSAELSLNKFNAELRNAEIARAAKLDFVFR